MHFIKSSFTIILLVTSVTLSQVSENDVSAHSVSDTSGTVTEKLSENDTVKNDLDNNDSTESSTLDSLNSPKESEAVIIESEEELILDGGEESLLPDGQQKSVASETPSDSIKDSTKTSQTPQALPADSSQVTSSTPQSPMRQAPISPIEPPPKEENVPLKIEQTKSINFAKNFSEYRSPKIAILLSLLAPGAGQAYAKNYLKTGIFAAVEAAMVTTGVILHYQGNQKWDKAKKFADKHYSVDKFKDYYNLLTNNFPDTAIKTIFEPDSNADAFINNAEDKNDDYYNDIRNEISTYIHGWDDAAPEFDDNFEINQPENGTYVFDDSLPYLFYYVDESGDTTTHSQYGFSDNQKEYNSQLSEANNKYRWSQNVFTLLLINHIASAIDAGITAKAHNDRLLGKKSVWQHINIKDVYVQTPVNTAQGIVLEVRF